MADRTRFIRPDATETVELDWGTLKWLHKPETTGIDTFSSGVVVLEPGNGHECHTHPESDELLYVLSGTGEQMIGDETQTVEPGMMVSIPAGVEHSTLNTGWEPLRFIAVYGPAGPESTIQEADNATIHPPGTFPED
ncbi:cupin domain-containing protein [Halocatena halophila]|uniref:cupin domain-containing protein n=1 Tax=Halocatena halophila TaxID=2814576 RepID=UPI002ED568FC